MHLYENIGKNMQNNSQIFVKIWIEYAKNAKIRKNTRKIAENMQKTIFCTFRIYTLPALMMTAESRVLAQAFESGQGKQEGCQPEWAPEPPEPAAGTVTE